MKSNLKCDEIWTFYSQVNEVHDGCTPLYRACETGNLNAVQILIARGADINNGHPKGMTAETVSSTTVVMLINSNSKVCSRNEMTMNMKCWLCYILWMHVYSNFLWLIIYDGPYVMPFTPLRNLHRSTLNSHTRAHLWRNHTHSCMRFKGNLSGFSQESVCVKSVTYGPS